MIALVKVADMVDVTTQTQDKAIVLQNLETEETLFLEVSQEQMEQIVTFVMGTSATPRIESVEGSEAFQIPETPDDGEEPEEAFPFRVVEGDDDDDLVAVQDPTSEA